MIYLILILAAMALIALSNLVFPPEGIALWEPLLAVVLLTVAVILVDGVFAFLIRRLPERWFSYRRPLFAVGPREARLYRALGVKRWAGLIPDLGCFTHFPKRHLAAPGDPAYTERYLLEAAYGIVIHAVNIPTGFLILFLWPGLAIRVALPVALVNAVLSLLPVLLLRSNFPRLVRLHSANLKRSAAKTE
ncbi:MAG: hypothetical protein IJF73_04195 [Clostridia bacterium]|nr:hypothetical protein [Clostridia bacterium]